MRHLILSLVILVFPLAAEAQSPVKDQAAIYDIVLTDVARSLATPAMMPAYFPALVPFIFADEELGTWEPGPQVSRMADTLLRALRDRRSNVALCEPVKDYACGGSVRGSVLRVTTPRSRAADTVEVAAQLTQARAEADPTVMVPRPLYYRYVLVRDALGWRIQSAQRATPDPRTA